MALGFIDDFVYGTAGHTAWCNVTKLKRLLNKAEEWRQKHGAKFEESQYVLLHVTHNRHKATGASISTNRVIIRPSDKAKYLGVIFDKELHFKMHLQYAVKKGTKAALALASIGKSTWGTPYQCIRQLFQATVNTNLGFTVLRPH
jgi:hypothetical protein